MSNRVFGAVVLDRQIIYDDFWLMEPFSRGQAWLDLILLANDDDRDTKSRGVDVHLKRGQVGRSVKSLAERWQWSYKKVDRFLEDLRDARKVSLHQNNVGTVITIIDYDVLFAALKDERNAGQTGEQNASQGTQNDAQNADRTPESEKPQNQNLRTGEGDPRVNNAPSAEEAAAWFEKHPSGYTREEIIAAWNGFTAAAVDGSWVTGKPPRPVADWRCALADELWKRRQIFGAKNSARPDGDAAPQPPGKSTITIQKMKEAAGL
jgi:hypothetical protein